MKGRKKFLCAMAVSLSVIMLSSNVAYATEGMHISDVQSDAINETVDVESEVIEEVISEDAGVEPVDEQGAIAETETMVGELSTEANGEVISEEIINETDLMEDVISMENPYVWASENFQISHTVINDWGTGYQCEISIANVGEDKIEDWNLVLETTDTIDNIWNASIVSSENRVYKLDNMGWNGDILPGNNVSFGYVASYEGELSTPIIYGISGTETSLTDGSYQVTYQVTDLWDNGYVGNIEIHNLTDTDLKNWKVTFDLSDDIIDLWNGNVTSGGNGQYTVEYASYNATIPAGGSVVIGFTAEAETLQIYPENYSVKVVVHNEMDTTSRDDVIGIAYFEPITEDDIRIADDGIQYAANQLNIVGAEGCTFEQIAALGEEYGFEIVGYIEFTNDYQVKFVNEKTYEELGGLKKEFEELGYIIEANYNMVSTITPNSEDTEISLINGYLPNDEKWNGYWSEYFVMGNWGLKAINAPAAWEYQDYMSSVKIGIYDNMFMPHEDIKYKKIWNFYNYGEDSEKKADEHGTSVAGVMTAGFNNNIGIAGVACKSELYAYAYETDVSDKDIKMAGTIMEYKYALALMIGNGVRVLNFSNGIGEDIMFSASGRIGNEEAIDKAENYLKEYTYILENFLERLIDREYDFVIVQSAGNDNDAYFVEDGSKYGCHVIERDEEGNFLEPIDENVLIGDVSAKYNSFFTYSDKLENRVIVVGSYGCRNNKLYTSKFSNVGERVDVLAPGEDIESIIPYNKYDDGLSGTSYSAPYVSGTAALIYSVNPELSGEQVKDIITETATEEILGISAYQEDQSGVGLLVPADNTKYKCLDAGAAVEMALNEKGETPTLGENTGFIMGFIGYKESEESDTEVICDAQISAYRYSVYDGNVEEDYQYTTTSDSDGYYSLCVDPGIYQVTIYKEGYIPLVIENVEVVEGVVTYQEDILTIKEARLKTRFEITGKVVDALNGNAISDANVRFREGWNQTTSSVLATTVLTDGNGEYTVKLKGGYYTAEITKEGYRPGYVNIVVYDSIEVQMAVLSPKLQENEMRIVLTWGDSPRDLDSHMYISDGYSNQHIYYGNKTAYDDGEMICQLDHDDTSSYGPETITLYMDKIGANYKYSVYQFSSDGDISLSGARVVVYCGENEPTTYHIPVQQEGRTWEVFTIENGEIFTINKRY